MFALVALDVTVNVALPAWLAVKVCEPDRPVPDTFIVRVPLFTTGAVTHDGSAKVPLDCSKRPDGPIEIKAVLPLLVWYGKLNCAPPAKLVAVVAVVALVALVAVEAFPLNDAVIVPALKLPEASRATRVEAVFALVALVASVTAPEPL